MNTKLHIINKNINQRAYIHIELKPTVNQETDLSERSIT